MPLSKIPPSYIALANYCGPTYDPTTNCGEESCAFLDTFTSAAAEDLVTEHTTDTGQSWTVATEGTVENGVLIFELPLFAGVQAAYVDVGNTISKLTAVVNLPADNGDLVGRDGQINGFGLALADTSAGLFAFFGENGAEPRLEYILESDGPVNPINFSASFWDTGSSTTTLATDIDINYGDTLTFEISISGNDAVIEISSGGVLIVSETITNGFSGATSNTIICCGGYSSTTAEGTEDTYPIDYIEVC